MAGVGGKRENRSNERRGMKRRGVLVSVGGSDGELW